MILSAIVCFLGVVSGIPLFRGDEFTPSPPGTRPSCATKSATFCEKVDKYPTKLIQSILLSKSFQVDDLFVDEREGLQEPPEYILHEDMLVDSKSHSGRKSRSAPRHSASGLAKRCPVLSKVALPKVAASSAGEWRFIVQDELTNITQQIRIHVCDHNEECRTFCTQFYSPVALVSLGYNDTVIRDTFWMPSSCRCHTIPVNSL